MTADSSQHTTTPQEPGEHDPPPEPGSQSTQAGNLADHLVQVHTWLRSHLEHIRQDADAYLATRDFAEEDNPPPVGLNLQIRQHCLTFCETLHVHHSGEEHMFVHLAQQHPHLAPALRRLSEEHRTVERIRDELERLLGSLATVEAERFRGALDRMSAELEAHLDFEESALIPVLSEVPFPPAGTD